MIGEGFLNFGISFADYDYVTSFDHFFWRRNHQRRYVGYCLFDVLLVCTHEPRQSNFFVVDSQFVSFADQALNQYYDGTFTKIVGSAFEAESQDADAILSCVTDEIEG